MNPKKLGNVVPLWDVYKYVSAMPANPLVHTSPVRTRRLVETAMPYHLAMEGLARLPREIVGNYYLERHPEPKHS